MANADHLAQLMKGVPAWNAWRRTRPRVAPDLEGADLRARDLSGANFANVDFERAIFCGATLGKVNLSDANLRGVDLSETQVAHTDLSRVTLRNASLNHSRIEECNLSKANLSNASLVEAHIAWSRFSDVDFCGASLHDATLRDLDLLRTNFSKADLTGADLSETYLPKTNFSNADLRGADFSRAVFYGTDFTGCVMGRTIFADNDLSAALGLETVVHRGPSEIGIRTVYLSKGNIPDAFLRGCGIPDDFITYMKSLAGTPIEFYSCFISYSTRDEDFAQRLYADLQSRRIRCWFAPHDLQGGKKLHEQIDEAIRLHDKLLLILSPASMASEWVKTEVAKARKRELRDHRRVLFPIRLVSFEALRDWECFDADAGKDSAREIREYFIPDFSNWKDHDSYQEALERLIEDLKADAQVAKG